jgi:hypothetical protein
VPLNPSGASLDNCLPSLDMNLRQRHIFLIKRRIQFVFKQDSALMQSEKLKNSFGKMRTFKEVFVEFSFQSKYSRIFIIEVSLESNPSNGLYSQFSVNPGPQFRGSCDKTSQ